MKKLMIAAAIVCAAAMSHAAAYTWQAKTSYVYKDGTTGQSADKLTKGTAYIFNAGTYNQQSLLTAIIGGSTLASLADAHSVYVTEGEGGKKSAVGTAISGGQAAQSAKFNYDGVSPSASPNTWQAYFAIMVDDKLYISSEQTATATEAVAGNDIKFQSQKSFSTVAASTSATYSKAGWYAVAPEPTSGLLLLLGMAGLALRRRRA